MAQDVFSDIDPAETTGLELATLLNSFRDAVLSNYSGATAPSTTYAYQFWADTTTGYLKIRNSANSGWVTLLKLSTGETDSSYSTPTAVTTTYTILSSDKVLMCASGTYTVTLPLAASNTGKTFKIIKAAAAGVITVGRSGSDTINGLTSVTLEGRYSSYEIYSDGTEWYITG